MFCDVIQIKANKTPDAFASFFEYKITKLTNETIIDPNVYNGNRKLFSQKLNFMSEQDTILVVKYLAIKHSEGHHRIPQRILIDGIENYESPSVVNFWQNI